MRAKRLIIAALVVGLACGLFLGSQKNRGSEKVSQPPSASKPQVVQLDTGHVRLIPPANAEPEDVERVKELEQIANGLLAVVEEKKR